MALRAAVPCARAAARFATAGRLAAAAPIRRPAVCPPAGVTPAHRCPPGCVHSAAVLGRQLRGYAAQAEPETKPEAEAEVEVNVEAEAEKEATKEAPKSSAGEAAAKQKSDADAKIDELKNNLAYALAETQNVRKIAQKDVADAKKFALKSFAKDLLDVMDNMERAEQSVKPEDLEDPKLKTLLDGVKLTKNSLSKAFESNGINVMEVEPGIEFDPEQHEALMNMPWEEGKESGTIGMVFKTGYNYRGRVLRAAQVGVVAEKDA